MSHAFPTLFRGGGPVILDGGMGTMLMAAGLLFGDPPELWNLDPARREQAPIGIPCGTRRELDAMLGDELARLGLDLVAELVALARGRLRPHQHAVPARLVDGFDHQLVEVVDDVTTLAVACAHEGVHLFEDRLLAEVVADHVRHEGVDRLVVRDGLIVARHSYFDPLPVALKLMRSPRLAMAMLRRGR